jgi:hypothetical protein
MAAAKDENRAYEVHPFRPTWRKSAERVSRLTAYATLVRARAERIAATRIALPVLLVITEPCASRTAREAMFSEAISSISFR